MHSTLHKLRSLDTSCQQFYKLFLTLWLLRTLHTEDIKKSACIRSIYQLLFWSSRLWNSRMDVQHKWLCALVTSRSDVQHYVDVRFLKWFLPIIVFSISITICVRQSYVTTSFQTYKWINNSCKCEQASVVLYCWKRHERKWKWKFEVPDSSVVGCGIVSNGKNDIPQGNIAQIFRIELWKNGGF